MIWIWIILGLVLITVFACLKVSSDYSRQEEKEDGNSETCQHLPVCGKYKATGGVNKCEHHKEERHGRWVVECKNRHKCSNCGFGRNTDTQTGWNFCPNCGADMRGDENERS